MERCHIVALLDFLDNLVIDEHALVELLASVNHAVAHCVNLLEAADAAIGGIGQDIEDIHYGLAMVGNNLIYHLLAAVGKTELQE